ncbi:hypothetical protein [Acidihalobacter prosperus]|uniref:Uncharacterized protein n=1 Tax=Acidihalobacter prosperus TaxID=160660 RepID=A0A1A6C8A7_9GAMM|nr:hypothetical protein [Acidihalobacter prosperus]OBS10803.1 hypothetical protein Thpro_020519 [Acidihalobacter prosperus]
MKWRRIDDYAIESDAGYTVCRVFIHARWHYEAWIPKAMDGWDRVIHREPDDDATEAKAACERHYEEMQS